MTPEQLYEGAVKAIRAENYDAAAAIALTGLLSMAIGAAKGVARNAPADKSGLGFGGSFGGGS